MTLSEMKSIVDLTPYPRPGGTLSAEEERAILGEVSAALLAEEERLPASLKQRDPRQLCEILRTIRPPAPVGRDLLARLDRLLWSDTLRRGIVRSADLARTDGVTLWQGDITRLDADGIVNAANSALLGCFLPLHNCIDNLIHLRGGMQIRLDCDALMRRQGREEPPGRAKITRAYNLPSKYILHTVGPIVEREAGGAEAAALKSCYTSCLDLAAEAGLRSVAFCAISTGVFRYPKEEACRVAVAAVREWLSRGSNLHVIFDVFSDEDGEIYERVLR